MKTLQIEKYILETLMPDLVGHDRRPAAFLVFLFLWMETRGSRSASVQISLRDMSEGTGLSKRAVQSAIATLRRRHLVTVTRDSPTSIPVYQVNRPWHRRLKG